MEAPAPEHLIKSGLPTEAMVASVLVAKYGWHLPLYRQAKMLASQGIDLDRSTLAFWVGYAAAELMPLYERLKANLLASAKLAVDETPVPVLDPGRGQTKTGYFWAMARDDRPWGGTDPPAVVYTYAPGRGGEHLEKLLANYRGIVQCDGYAPYKKLPADRITVAFCWAICGASSSRSPSAAMRRSPPKPSRALPQLYEIEKDVRGTSAEQRRAARQARSRPLIDALKTFFEQQLARLSGGSDTAKIIRYGLRHWDGLIRFLDDGRIELDTNIVERSMRPQALTRKNALFAGHDDGAENWAILASLIETCQTERHRSASLARRCSHPPRQSLAQQSPRRTPSLDLGRRAPATAARRLNCISRFTPLTANQARTQRVPTHRLRSRDRVPKT